jgi:hypothetical protein
MALFNQLAFPSSTGLPGTYNGVSMWGPPTLDGFREDEPGITTVPGVHQLEAGYTGGGRFTYGGASGVPVAVVDCIKDVGGDFIYMCFTSRYDVSFDNDDFVMVVLRPGGPGGSNANDRRIDVQPVVSGTAGSAGGAKTAPAVSNDYQVATGLTPEIRTAKDPQADAFYSRTGSPSPTWAPLATTPAVGVKVRSVRSSPGNNHWSVELKIPTTIAAGGASWVNLGNTFGLWFVIGQVFTNPSGFEDVVQYQWPMDPTNPLNNILADPFDSTLKVDWDPTTLGTATILAPGATNTALGVHFYGGYNAIGVLDAAGTNVTGVLDMTLNKTNRFVARLQNNSPNTAPKIIARFRLADFGLSGGMWNAAWNDVPATAPSANPAPSGGVDIPTAGSPTSYTQIECDWKISAADRTKYGPLNRDQCVWVELDTKASIPSPGKLPAQIAEQSMFHNLQVTNLSTVQPKALVDSKLLDKRNLVAGKHQLLIQVISDPVAVSKDAHTPMERYLAQAGHSLATEVASVRMSTAPVAVSQPPSFLGRILGRAPTTVEIQPAALEPVHIAERVDIDKIPILAENPILSGKVALAPIRGTGGIRIPPTRVASWHSVVNGYQRTNKTLTFDGKKRNVMVYAGSYAYLARHVLLAGETVDQLQFTHSLATTPGMKSLGGGLYLLNVAPTQKLNLVNNLKAQPFRRGPAVGPVLTRPFTAIGGLIGRLRG